MYVKNFHHQFCDMKKQIKKVWQLSSYLKKNVLYMNQCLHFLLGVYFFLNCLINHSVCQHIINIFSRYAMWLAQISRNKVSQISDFFSIFFCEFKKTQISAFLRKHLGHFLINFKKISYHHGNLKSNFKYEYNINIMNTLL